MVQLKRAFNELFQIFRTNRLGYAFIFSKCPRGQQKKRTWVERRFLIYRLINFRLLDLLDETAFSYCDNLKKKKKIPSQKPSLELNIRANYYIVFVFSRDEMGELILAGC